MFLKDTHQENWGYKLAILSLVVFPLLGVIAAVGLTWNQYVFPLDIGLFLVFYVLTGLGITVGYHRMLTHQGFRAPEWLRFLLLVFGAMTMEGPADQFAATHIKHHAHSDDEHDPHSPLQGFWHAHLGWMFDSSRFPLVREYAPHLLEDRVVRFVSRWTLAWMSLSLLLPFLLGGWTGFMWGGLVRIFVVNHITWSVNSICHTFGRRTFETTDESRNEWIVGLLALGEGWHNNHHAFPRNAFHGMRWWQFDLSGLLIHLLEKIGLIGDVQRINRETEEEHRSRAQRMLQALAGLRESVISSITSARLELAASGAKLLTAACPERCRRVSDGRLEQFHAFHQQTLQRVDAMLKSISASAHLKRQRLLQYQREAQLLLQEYKQRFPAVFGDWRGA